MDYTTRSMQLPTQLRADLDGGEKYIEGYFGVFNEIYKMSIYSSEVIEPGAFAATIRDDDIRALINHDTTLVLGRNRANTLELREDDRGLWGRVKINEADSDALNLWQRVERGDVDQCSIGFRTIDSEREVMDDEIGTIRYHLKKIKLYEVSVCTFPAYKSTSVSATERGEWDTETRKQDTEAFREIMKRRIARWQH